MSDRTGVQNLLAAVAVAGLLSAAGLTAGRAETVMQQCGQQYQAAKTANTLNGQTWNQFRTECAARLKASASPATQPAPQPGVNPLKPTPAAVTPAPTPTSVPTPPPTVPASTAPAPVAPAPPTTTAAVPAAKPAKPASAGRVAFVARERQCGSEWKANKATLVVQTPGLTWPKYLSQCNTRLKAAGQ